MVRITPAQDTGIGMILDGFKDMGEEVRADPKFATNIVAPRDGIVIKSAIRTRSLQQHGVGREIRRHVNIRLPEPGMPLAKCNTDRSGEKVTA